MGFFDSLFGSSDQSYPTRPTGPVPDPCGSGPYEPADRGGFFNKLLAPKQLAYPTPSCYGRPNPPPAPAPTPTVVPVLVATGPATPATPAVPATPAAPGTQPVAQPSAAQPTGGAAPVAFVMMPLPSALAASQPVATPAPAVAATTGATPAPVGTPAPSDSGDGILPGEPYPTAPDKILRAFVFNPELTSSIRTAQQEFIEETLGEELCDEIATALTARMVSLDGTPVAFVVPDGCDSVDFLCGPIEVNPGCGCDGDLDQVITVGTAKLSANVDGIDRPLIPGEQIIVTLPWRAASWVDLPANRLRVTLLANFYNAQLSG